MKATWNDTLIAESWSTQTVDGFVYFPKSSLKDEQMLQSSTMTSVCSHKGTATYYHLVVDGKKLHNAVWEYKAPKEGFEKIKEHVGFWNGVVVS